MNRSSQSSNAPGNRVAAWVCLLAVLLLWAPLWAAAYQAAGMGCCDGVMCPLHGHMAKKSSQEGAPTKEAPMTCEHHGGAAGMNCSMACCNTTDPIATPAMLFVLPALLAISAPLPAGDSISPLLSSWTSPVFDPASPPPRALPLNQ